MKFSDGRWVEEESFNFHKRSKDILRHVIDSDPEITGANLDMVVNDMPFNEKWALCEPGDGGMVKNEDFLAALIFNYNKSIDNYKPTPKERALAERTTKYALAIYRNDSAYFERLGGICQFIVVNIDKFSKIKNIESEHSNLLEGIYNWWKANDRRRRTRPWISWVFKYLIKQYKVNMFYRRSINMAFIFFVNNADKWKHDETYEPENWFPNKRGKLANALYGWCF